MFVVMNGFLIVVIALVAACGAALIGWLLGARPVAMLRSERDSALDRFKAAARDLEAASRDRESAEDERQAFALELASLRTRAEADAEAHDARVAGLIEARDAMAAQFQDVAAKLLDRAQASFLESAGERFKASETAAGTQLAALLQPVNERLARYEEAVGKIEQERTAAFGNLHGMMESLRLSNEGVKTEAARLSNSLRNAPKARGRWGEQQLRNVLESCGLSEYADFQTEVSVTGDDGGRLRPDVIVRVPGGQSLVIDAKVSLNAYQDAFHAEDEGARIAGLAAHAASVKAHINSLGNKSYWSQFESAPDYVILFIPGEHFLSAALETDSALWDFAFEKRVLLATPTNLIAIARTVSAVWRQERMADQAREIAALGKELYARMATMGGHITRVGKNLDTAVGAYNSFVGSFESQVLTSARRFEALDIDTAGKAIDALPMVDAHARPLSKLAAIAGAAPAEDGQADQ